MKQLESLNEDTGEEFDYYKVGASKRLGIPYEEVTEQQRRQYKQLFFLEAYATGGARNDKNA